MKKTVYAMAAILLSLGFAACSEDDDEKDVFDDVTTELTDDVIYSFSYDNATMFETATVEISLLKKGKLHSIFYGTERYYIPDRRR